MIDNQHKRIKGYRDLTTDDITNMNAVKEIAEEVGALLAQIGKLEGVDQRWLAIARTELQKGFMFAVRAIARPETF